MGETAVAVPAMEQMVDVGPGMQICCVTAGDPAEQPLLLIAGLGQQLNAWPPELVDAFVARGFYVIRFDNRDIGRSSRAACRPPTPAELLRRRYADEQYTLGDMARDTVGLLDALAIERVHLAGMSMGGMIAQTVVAEYPERVVSLSSIMSTTGARRIGRPALATWARMAGRPPATREAMADRAVAMFRHIGSRGFPFDEPAVRAVALESWERAGGANEEGVARQLAAIFKSGDRTAECRRITVPTLVIHGDRDPMVNPTGGVATAEAIPGARLRTIPGMGHDLPRGAWWQLVEDITAHAARALDSSAPRPADERFRLPDGPRTPPFFNGLMMLFAQRQFSRFLHKRYGDAFTATIPGFGRTVFVARPDLVKTVYTGKPDVLHAGENPLGEFFGPGSLFSMDEDEHLKERRMLLPPFHGDRMLAYHGLIEEETLRAVAAWPEGEPFATLPTFNTITLRVILRAVFGAEGSQLTELERMIPPMTRLGQKIVAVPPLGRDLGRWSIGGRYRPMRRRYDEIIDALIQKHLDDPQLDQRIDILALMIRSMLADGPEIDRGHLADELITLLMAGHETTASSLAWAVERLTRHPEILARLEAEADTAGSTYRTATINEMQRIRPVIAGSGRMVKKPFVLGEWRLPPGTMILANGLALHEDERLHERAETFDPDRYVGRKPDTYAWIPFGGGVRRCIGAAFALMEMDVVLRTVLRNFELQPTTDPPERPQFRGVATAPAKRGMAVVRRRGIPLGGSANGAGAEVSCPVDAASSPAAACPVDHAPVNGAAAR